MSNWTQKDLDKVFDFTCDVLDETVSLKEVSPAAVATKVKGRKAKARLGKKLASASTYKQRKAMKK